MKPHISLQNGLWWCITRGDPTRACFGHTPTRAYKSWRIWYSGEVLQDLRNGYEEFMKERKGA